MGKLIKYEFRKTRTTKLVIIGLSLLFEMVFLLGILTDREELIGCGIGTLSVCGAIGLFYIGIESVIVLHNDLKTKQSYMLFLTPKTSYEIMGAKTIENGIAIIAAYIYFALLAVLDVFIITSHYGELEKFLEEIKMFLAAMSDVPEDFNLTAVIILCTAMLIAGWLTLISSAQLSTIISAAVLAGKKMSGLAGFGIFIVIGIIYSNVVGKFFDFLIETSMNDYLLSCVIIAVSLIWIALMYVASCKIIDKKLSV